MVIRVARSPIFYAGAQPDKNAMGAQLRADLGCLGWRGEFEGAKRPRIEGEAREEAGGGVWGGGSVSPSPEKFSKL